jgi:hypothetical protein
MATQLRIFAPPVDEVLPIEGGRFLIDTIVSPVNLYLPHMPEPGVNFNIYDATRNASVNPITIRTLYGETINGSSVLVLNGSGNAAEIFREDDSPNFIAVIAGVATISVTGSGVHFYDTVAALRAESSIAVLVDGMPAQTYGRLFRGDAEGKFWYYEALSNAVDNGSTIVQPTSIVGSGRWLAWLG